MFLKYVKNICFCKLPILKAVGELVIFKAAVNRFCKENYIIFSLLSKSLDPLLELLYVECSYIK